jgi:DNA-binding transcriptional MerR regulator
MQADVDGRAVIGGPDEWSIDELARRAQLPVRTIREYQTLGVLPAPRRRGRIGIYRMSHLVRLELIGRLQARGYSLTSIRDLLGAWRDGADLGEVLGLAPDQLVHLDEPGVSATLDQLATILPSLVPDRLDELLATGSVEACGPDRYCIPSPSLLQLTVDALDAGYAPQPVLTLLQTIGTAAGTIADATTALLGDPPPDADRDRLLALAERGRGLLAHGTGRLTVHTIGRRLGATDEDSVASVLRQHVEGDAR